jgi:hypothetical protein
LKGKARTDALYIAKAESCKGTEGKFFCESPSAALIDRGPAHGKDDLNNISVDPLTGEKVGREKHRIYELDQRAIDASKKAGEDYANRALIEAAGDNRPVGNRTRKSTRAGYVEVDTAEGTKQVKVAASFDKIRDEAMYLEELKQRTVTNQWKYLRAKRLSTGVIRASNLGDDDQKFVYGYVQGRLPDVVAKVYKDVSNERAIAGQDAELSKEIIGLIKKAQNERAKSIDDAQKRKDFEAKSKAADKVYSAAQKNMVKCMGRNAWCKSEFKSQTPNGTAEFEDLSKKGGDVGAAFDDSREFIFNRVDNFNRTKSYGDPMAGAGADFSKATDAKTKSKPYEYMMKQSRENQQTMEAFMKAEQAKSKENQRRGLPPSSYSDRRNYDPNNMGAAQTWQRGRVPAASTLGTGGIPVQGGTVSAAPTGRSTQQPRQGGRRPPATNPTIRTAQ